MSHPCTMEPIGWCPGCEVEGVVGLICAIFAWHDWMRSERFTKSMDRAMTKLAEVAHDAAYWRAQARVYLDQILSGGMN